MISPQQIQMVQRTWQQLLPIQNETARLFYERLFEIDPGLRALFPSADMRAQGRKFTSMLSVAVGGLTRLEGVVPAIRDLGRLHVRFGVTAAHYDSVAEALLWTLHQVLGEALTVEVTEAWVEAYTLLSTAMKQGAALEVN